MSRFCHRRFRVLHPFRKAGIPLDRFIVADSIIDCLFLADQHKDLLRAGYSGIKQVPLQHNVMAHHKRHYDDRVLTALGLVDRAGIRQNQLVKLRCVISHIPAIKIHGKLPLLQIYF